jgi:hypothetical protein
MATNTLGSATASMSIGPAEFGLPLPQSYSSDSMAGSDITRTGADMQLRIVDATGKARKPLGPDLNN